MSHATNAGTRRRLTHAAVLTSVALGVSTVAAVAPARAQSAPLTYDCTTILGPTQMAADIDSDLPATMAVGQSRPVKLVSKVTVPASIIGLAYGFLQSRFAEGAAVAQGAISGPSGMVATVTDLAVPRSAVPATGDMVVTATGTGTAFKPTKPGVYTVTAGDFTSTLDFLKEDLSSSLADQVIPCTAPAAANRAVDRVTVVKAGSTSTSSAKVKRRNHRATARSVVAGQYGNDPTGTVRFVLKKGRSVIARTTRSLDASNAAQVTFKRKLAKGRYVLTTTYGGNADLNASTDVVRFRVKH